MDSLMELGNFAAHGGLTVGAKGFGELAKSARQPLGRLIDHHRAGVGSQESEASGTALLGRQEAFKDKAVAREAGSHQCGHKSSGTGQAFHLNAGAAALAREHKAGVRDSRGAGIAHQSDVAAPLNAFYN